jgi:hypothetical protein
LDSLTPNDFDAGYLAMIQAAKTAEEAMMTEIRHRLAEAFPEDKVDKAIEVIRSLRHNLPGDIDFDSITGSNDYV